LHFYSRVYSSLTGNYLLLSLTPAGNGFAFHPCAIKYTVRTQLRDWKFYVPCTLTVLYSSRL
jgi:hypothetical protein